MSTAVGQAQPVAPAPEAVATPFEQASVTLIRQEHVQLGMQAHSWKALHQRAVARIEQQRQQHSQALEQIKALERLVQEYERVRLREAELREQLVYSLEQARRREIKLHTQRVCEREQAQQQEAALREQLAQEQAYSCELRHRLFGQRSEKSHALNKASAPSQEHKRPRGQQREWPFPGAKTILQCGYRREEDLQRTGPNSGCWRPTCALLSRQ